MVEKILKSRLRKAVAMELLNTVMKAENGQKKIIFGKPFTYSGGKSVSDKGGAGGSGLPKEGVGSEKRKKIALQSEEEGRLADATRTGHAGAGDAPKKAKPKTSEQYNKEVDDRQKKFKELSYHIQDLKERQKDFDVSDEGKENIQDKIDSKRKEFRDLEKLHTSEFEKYGQKVR